MTRAMVAIDALGKVTDAKNSQCALSLLGALRQLEDLEGRWGNPLMLR